MSTIQKPDLSGIQIATEFIRKQVVIILINSRFQVIFDSDPAPLGHSAANQIEMMSQAMIRGVMDESGEQFVAYFLPTEETMEKRAKDFTEGKDYDDDQVCKKNYFCYEICCLKSGKKL